VRWQFLMVASFTCAAAAALCGLVLYEQIIVPLLLTVRSVPFWWWALAASPLWLGAGCLGWYANSLRELVAASFVGTLGSHLYLYWASVTNRPGLVNQPLAEVDPVTFWTEALAWYWLLLSVPFVLGHIARRLANRRWRANGRTLSEGAS